VGRRQVSSTGADRMLRSTARPRSANAVKHFKFELRGQAAYPQESRTSWRSARVISGSNASSSCSAGTGPFVSVRRRAGSLRARHGDRKNRGHVIGGASAKVPYEADLS
jgi:hypothetical protein